MAEYSKTKAANKRSRPQSASAGDDLPGKEGEKKDAEEEEDEELMLAF